MFTSKNLLRWTRLFMPDDKKNWIDAMQAEMFEIAGEKERRRFALGCLKSALNAVMYSRKGISYIARGTGAISISAVSFLGIWHWNYLTTPEEYLVYSKLITGLCIFYSIAAILLLMSLKILKVYALLGLSFALMVWGYCVGVRPEFETMPLEYLIALSFEMSVFMVILFGAALFLNGLYSPDMIIAQHPKNPKKS